MSVKQVLDNIKYFVATVLKNAYFDNDWNKEAVKNAMNWAEYCEKLYVQAKGKPVEEQLNNYLKTLALEPTSVVPNANFDFLKNATEALNMALLQNPQLSRELMAIVIQKYQADGAFKEKLLGLVQLKSSFLALEEWSKFRKNEQEECNLNQMITTELALAALRNRFFESEDTSKISCSSNSSRNYNGVEEKDYGKKATRCLKRREVVINSFFSQMTKSPEHLVLLVHVWCMPSSNGSDISLMQTMLMQLLLCKVSIGKLEYDPRISRMIWSLKPDMLSKLSLLYSPFCKKYCEYLVACGQQLQICYCTGGVKWKPREDEEEAVTYDELVQHFMSLGTVSDKIRRYIVKTLHSLALSSVCCVWEDILNKLEK